MTSLATRIDVAAVYPHGSDATLRGYLGALGLSGHAFGPPTPSRAARGLLERARFRWLRTTSEARLAGFLLRHSDRTTVLHCDLSPVTSFLLVAGLSLVRPVCLTVHTAWPRLGGLRGLSWRLKLRLLLRAPRFELLAANDDARRSLRPYVRERRLAQVDLAYSTFDSDELEAVRADPLARSELDARLGLVPGRFLVVTVAQFIERKGYVALLAAARRLRACQDDFQFLWFSTATPDAEAQARLMAAELGDRFRVLEPARWAATRRELLRAVQAADAFVLPSLQEGLPLALVEALVLARPVIATAVNAVPEAVVHGESGLLVPPGEDLPLAEALLALRADASLRTRLGQAGRQRALERFERRSAAAVTWQAYTRAVAGCAGRG
jgi:glycosyltransferase involved in cell wall biosynthesis